MTAPGWYPDPNDPARQRYFDGVAWTQNYANPVAQPLHSPVQPAQQPARQGMSKGLKIGLGAAAGIFGITAIGFLGEASDKETASSPSQPRSETTRTADSPTTTSSGFTASQDNAIAKAKSYLGFTAYSRKGLINQLEYEKFSTADAEFAVQYLETNAGVDWNQQAVEKAKSYLDYSAYSKEGLVSQLEYEGFTPSEAQYGADQAYG